MKKGLKSYTKSYRNRVSKLKQKDLPEFRQKLYEEQLKVCPLCKLEIPKGEEVLDHDHATGLVRAVLHRDCNSLEGIITNFLSRRGKGLMTSGGIFEFLSNLFWYIRRDYTHNPYHPKHRTPEDKVIREYRRRLRAAKTEPTKEKYRQLIKEMQSD